MADKDIIDLKTQTAIQEAILRRIVGDSAVNNIKKSAEKLAEKLSSTIKKICDLPPEKREAFYKKLKDRNSDKGTDNEKPKS